MDFSLYFFVFAKTNVRMKAIWGHSFSSYAKLSEKVTPLTL